MREPACLQIPLLAVKTGQPRFLQLNWICNAQKKPPYQEASLCLAVRTRLELATPCVTGMYSNQTELPDRLHHHVKDLSFFSQMRVQKYDFFFIQQRKKINISENNSQQTIPQTIKKQTF